MMYEPSFSPDAGLHSVIVQNAAVLLNQDNHSTSITADVYNRMTNAGSDSGKQKLQTNRRKSDSDAPHLPSFSQTSPSSCQSSPSPSSFSPSPFSQPVSPDSYGAINCVAGVGIHGGFSKPTEKGGVASGPAQVCRVQPLTSLMPSGSDGLFTEDPQTPASEADDSQSQDSPQSPGRGRPRGVLVPPTSIPCMICGDRSTGKHYGAFSCDGCKGFFRRSIRKKTGYRCRFNHECKMTKDMRNQCRDCRLRKCISAGMKKEAVQNERDRITHRRAGGDVTPSPPEGVLLTAEILMNAERLCKQQVPPSGEARQDSERCLASVMDVAESVKQQLLVLVEWAKAVPAFAAMHLEDKIKLLKAHSGEHLLLGIAWRSLNSDKYLLLGNDKLIPRLASGIKVPHGRFATDEDMPLSNINWIASRVLDDVVQPLRQLKVDSQEFIILRCMIFFDPLLHGLTDPDYVHRVRLQGQLLLEDYIMDRHDVECRGRFGQIMFMLPYLQTIATAMIQQIQLAKMDGFTGVDTLITEMLLSSADETLDKQVFPADVVHPMLAPPPPHRSLRPHDAAFKSPERSLIQPEHSPTSPEGYALPPNYQSLSQKNASISPDGQSHLQHMHSSTSPVRSMLKQEQGLTSPSDPIFLRENAYVTPDGTIRRYEQTHSSSGPTSIQYSHSPPDRECVPTSDMEEHSVLNHRLQLPTQQRTLCEQRADSMEMRREYQSETSDERDTLVSNRYGKRVIYHQGMYYTREIDRFPERDYSNEDEMEYTEDIGPVEHSTRQYDSRNFALNRATTNQPKVVETYGPMMQEPCDLSPHSSYSCTSSGERSPAVSGHSSYACSNPGDRSPGDEQLQPLNLQQVPD